VSESRYKEALALVDSGVLHLREGRLEEASTTFLAASELAPVAAAFDGQGCVALVRGDLERARDLFKQAYEMDESYDEALANLALVEELGGHPEEAKVLYDQSIRVLPRHVAARNNRAALEYDRGAGKMVVLHELQKASLFLQHGVVKANIARLTRK
jgi:Flp pilus assembly protein TadD